ncbi:MAG: glycosylhydrolase-like jelly roll fold domain-containing protein [Vicinamibacterales bacterium]
MQLELPAGESIILSTHAAFRASPQPATASGEAVVLEGPWTIQFDAGGPTLPAGRTLERLSSWTTLAGDDVKAFSGTATYSTRFPLPGEAADRWRFDLGQVHESAHVRLNGLDLETLIGPRFRLEIPSGRLRESNLLEVSVTNLMANRIAALDRAGVSWKTFYNVNFPARLPENRGPDGLFTAARWEPRPSGLLGPVVLAPLPSRRP